MSSVEISRRIAAPRERVWEVFTDLGSAAERIQAITSLEILTDGPVGDGTRWRETRVMMGKEATEEMWISGFDPPASYEVDAASHGSRYKTQFRFTEDADGTQVWQRFSAEADSFGAKVMSVLLGWMMKGFVRKCFEADMDDLQKVCEAGDAAAEGDEVNNG